MVAPLCGRGFVGNFGTPYRLRTGSFVSSSLTAHTNILSPWRKWKTRWLQTPVPYGVQDRGLPGTPIAAVVGKEDAGALKAFEG